MEKIYQNKGKQIYKLLETKYSLLEQINWDKLPAMVQGFNKNTEEIVHIKIYGSEQI